MSDLIIQNARPDETTLVCAFYHDVIDRMKDAEYSPAWQRDIYPSDEYLSELVEKGEMYIGWIGKTIAAAMAVNHTCNDGYADAPWRIDAARDEVLLIHLLCVHPQYAHQGYAKQLVRYVLSMAENSCCKCVRLDVLAGNLPALRLYEGMGFMRITALPMYYEDTGWTEFVLYEYPLQGGGIA